MSRKKRQKATVAGKLLDEIDRKLVLHLIENPSYSDQELGERLGLGRQAINRRRNSEAVKNELNDFTGLRKAEVRRVSTKAFRKLEELIDDPDPRIAFQAASNLVKMGLDVRGDLKGSDNLLLGHSISELEFKILLSQLEVDKIEFRHKIQEYLLDKSFSKALRDSMNSDGTPKDQDPKKVAEMDTHFAEYLENSSSEKKT